MALGSVLEELLLNSRGKMHAYELLRSASELGITRLVERLAEPDVLPTEVTRATVGSAASYLAICPLSFLLLQLSHCALTLSQHASFSRSP